MGEQFVGGNKKDGIPEKIRKGDSFVNPGGEVIEVHRIGKGNAFISHRKAEGDRNPRIVEKNEKGLRVVLGAGGFEKGETNVGLSEQIAKLEAKLNRALEKPIDDTQEIKLRELALRAQEILDSEGNSNESRLVVSEGLHNLERDVDSLVSQENRAGGEDFSDEVGGRRKIGKSKNPESENGNGGEKKRPGRPRGSRNKSISIGTGEDGVSEGIGSPISAPEVVSEGDIKGRVERSRQKEAPVNRFGETITELTHTLDDFIKTIRKSPLSLDDAEQALLGEATLILGHVSDFDDESAQKGAMQDIARRLLSLYSKAKDRKRPDGKIGKQSREPGERNREESSPSLSRKELGRLLESAKSTIKSLNEEAEKIFRKNSDRERQVLIHQLLLELEAKEEELRESVNDFSNFLRLQAEFQEIANTVRSAMNERRQRRNPEKVLEGIFGFPVREGVRFQRKNRGGKFGDTCEITKVEGLVIHWRVVGGNRNYSNEGFFDLASEKRFRPEDFRQVSRSGEVISRGSEGREMIVTLEEAFSPEAVENMRGAVLGVVDRLKKYLLERYGKDQEGFTQIGEQALRAMLEIKVREFCLGIMGKQGVSGDSQKVLADRLFESVFSKEKGDLMSLEM